MILEWSSSLVVTLLAHETRGLHLLLHAMATDRLQTLFQLFGYSLQMVQTHLISLPQRLLQLLVQRHTIRLLKTAALDC